MEIIADNQRTTSPVSTEQSDFRCIRRAIPFLLIFFAAAILALNPDWISRPLARAVDSLAVDWPFITVLAAGLAYPTLQGVLVMSLVWSCWFSDTAAEVRARVATGVFASVCAGMIARVVQRTLPTDPKPLFDPVLHLHIPAILGDVAVLRATSNPSSHTFPSERATLFAGLALTVFLARPKLGLLALACTLLTEVSRIGLGYHYLPDIAGSVSLAAAFVWLAHMRWSSQIGDRLVSWERAAAPASYACAFFASYQIATAFQDLRDIAAGLMR
jgi:membrane-associated phospholipid phosphatase